MYTKTGDRISFTREEDVDVERLRDSLKRDKELLAQAETDVTLLKASIRKKRDQIAAIKADTGFEITE